jgi:hypothetical protein
MGGGACGSEGRSSRLARREARRGAWAARQALLRLHGQGSETEWPLGTSSPPSTSPPARRAARVAGRLAANRLAAIAWDAWAVSCNGGGLKRRLATNHLAAIAWDAWAAGCEGGGSPNRKPFQKTFHLLQTVWPQSPGMLGQRAARAASCNGGGLPWRRVTLPQTVQPQDGSAVCGRADCGQTDCGQTDCSRTDCGRIVGCLDARVGC